jgi:hypothetical protein
MSNMKTIHGMTEAENKKHRNRDRAETVCVTIICGLCFYLGYIISILINC